MARSLVPGAPRRQRRRDAAQLGAGGTVVRALVGVVGLHGGGGLTRRALRRRVLALALLIEERGDGDGGQDPDDQDHDQKLDEREALLAIEAIAKAVEHGGGPPP